MSTQFAQFKELPDAVMRTLIRSMNLEDRLSLSHTNMYFYDFLNKTADLSLTVLPSFTTITVINCETERAIRLPTGKLIVFQSEYALFEFILDCNYLPVVEHAVVITDGAHMDKSMRMMSRAFSDYSAKSTTTDDAEAHFKACQALVKNPEMTAFFIPAYNNQAHRQLSEEAYLTLVDIAASTVRIEKAFIPEQKGFEVSITKRKENNGYVITIECLQ